MKEHRELQTLIDELERHITHQGKEVDRLHEVNAELLEALKTLIEMDVAYQRGDKVAQAVESAQAVIAKAEEQA